LKCAKVINSPIYSARRTPQAIFSNFAIQLETARLTVSPFRIIAAS
jgi:hypothetical protein